MIIVRIFDVVYTQIVKDPNTNHVEKQNASCFSDEWNLDAVQTKADCFTSTKDTSEDANVVSEFLR